VLRLLGGEVNLVATQLELNRDHHNTVVFGAAGAPAGLDPMVDVVLTGGDVRVTITGRASVLKRDKAQFDVDRTKALWDSVYHAPEALIKEGDWIDRASFGIPYTYGFTGTVLAEAMRERGDQASANAILNRVKAIAKAARIPELERME
jgi:hypothetical protein